MKTLGRSLIILIVTGLVAGALYLAFNSSTALPADFNPRGEQFQPDSFNPDFEAGRPERDDFSGGWMFGLTKNMLVISVMVSVIVLPKNLGKKKRLATAKANPGDLS